jgi:3',5'-cyclic AMP phosphodiesterase CpdA
MDPIVIPYRSGRIAVLADLHWDSYAKAGANPIDAHDLREGLGADLDALIIAGDLANGPPENWGFALRALMQSVVCDHVYILPGNHDYYLHGLDGDDALQLQAEFSGASFVQKRELRHGNTRILCCTLWTDFELSGYAELSKAIARRVMQDYQRITKPDPDQDPLSVERVELRRRVPVTPDDLAAVHRDHRDWLGKALSAPHFAGAAGQTVVVTHHGPHPAAAGDMDALTAAFHSDLNDLIQRYQPDVWFFGHSHRRLRAQVGATDICNVSVGYPNERQVAGSGHLTEMCFWGPDG